VQADYSQIEPRVIASLSKDPVMLAAYAEGKDIYTAIAEPLGMDRQAGKLLILAMSYGVGPDKIANNLGISVTKAKHLLDDFTDEFPSLTEYKNHVIKEASSRRPMPNVRTILGRRRFLPDLNSSDNQLRSRAKRQAFNAVIQGSAADIIKVAMVRAAAMIPDESKMLLTVHDEILILSPEEHISDTVSALSAAMQDVVLPQITVPLVADVKVVSRWGEAK
jgi:DNA polymerase-1